MKKKSDVTRRVEEFRAKTEASGNVRADIYIPEELRDRIKAISSINNWKYLETVAALTALGTEVFESACHDTTTSSPDCVKQGQPDVSSIKGSLGSSLKSLDYTYASRDCVQNTLSSFIKKRKEGSKND